MMPELPTFGDVEKAAEVISGHAVRTPLLRCEALDRLCNASVFVKPESLQLTGSFKFRGAYNAIANLAPEDRARGIVASSSGNHAQGIARAARLFGVKASILMPTDAPGLKIERTRLDGAEIVFYDRKTGDREKEAEKLLAERGGTFIHPFEHFHVIAGQGTCGLEVCEEFLSQGLNLDRFLICTGGGGLTAGIALAVKHHFPSAILHIVEPAGFDDYAKSLISGKREYNEKTSGSICDAIITPRPGERSFAVCKDLLGEGIVVTDEEALDAVRFAYQEMKLVVEPGGAVALAGLVKSATRFAGENIVVILSGGNVDPGMFNRAIGRS